jgi:hypothetical protein
MESPCARLLQPSEARLQSVVELVMGGYDKQGVSDGGPEQALGGGAELLNNELLNNRPGVNRPP